MKKTSRILANKRGATAIEYGLIAALVSVAAVAALGSLGNSLSSTFANISNQVSKA